MRAPESLGGPGTMSPEMKVSTQACTFIDVHFQNGKQVYYFPIVLRVRVNKNVHYFEDVGSLNTLFLFVCRDESVAVRFVANFFS